MARLYGLIGKKLAHSFSKKYFTSKFKKEKIEECSYELFELESINQLKRLISDNPHLAGLNVTLPFKSDVIALLDEVDPAAKEIGAVNVIKIKQGRLIGYNSDYYGFKQSLGNWIEQGANFKALVLGTGGSSRAVKVALDDLNIEYLCVSRNATRSEIAYEQVNEALLSTHRLVINTTPLGMYPNVDVAPEIPYSGITPENWLYDLVYNPEETLFMAKGKISGARVKNGLEMLQVQAEKSWEIWNS
ncbi:MAG: shikimate dehydrogenase [Cyclobacteriaceae bacterium]